MILFTYFFRSGLVFPEFVTRLISAYVVVIILHLFMQPGIFKSLELMRYLFTHTHKFESTLMPFFICLMKLSVEFCVEITNILTGFKLDDELWIIMCYTAICCISDMDEQYYQVFEDSVKSRLEEQEEFQLSIETDIKPNIKLIFPKFFNTESRLSIFQRLCYALVLFLHFLYETVYFYFFPYISLLIVIRFSLN